jgi:hypothetical protein
LISCPLDIDLELLIIDIGDKYALTKDPIAVPSILPDARQVADIVPPARQPRSGHADEALRPTVVEAERSDELGDLLMRRVCQILCLRPTLEEAREERSDLDPRCLVEHDADDQHPPRILADELLAQALGRELGGRPHPWHRGHQ